MRQINLGIIGLGPQGKVFLHNALELEGVEIIGVADISKTALNYAKKLGVNKVFTNYEDLLGISDLNAVIISLPNFLHLEATTKAAEARKDILLEKPLARNVAEGEEIISTSKKNGVKLMVGYPLRFNLALSMLHDEIVDGNFGNVRLAEATNVSGGPFSPKNDRAGPVKVSSWWFDKELAGGGALLDLGSHLIDLLIWYFGDIEYAQSYLGHIFNNELEDSATCLLKFKKGTLATVKTGWFSKDFLQSVQICGTAKNQLINVSSQSLLKKVWTGVSKKIGLSRKDAFYRELEYFVNCLKNDELPQPSGEEGLESLKVVASAYQNSVNC